jgi:hypothetical protein
MARDGPSAWAVTSISDQKCWSRGQASGLPKLSVVSASIGDDLGYARALTSGRRPQGAPGYGLLGMVGGGGV